MYTITVTCNYGDKLSPLINSFDIEAYIVAIPIMVERAAIASKMVIHDKVECILTLTNDDILVKRIVISSL